VLTRFDHAILGVRDLAEATERFRALGFDVQPGGRHTGRGTHNAIIRFGLDYLELLSVYDRAEREALGARGAAILRFLDRRQGGVMGYCLAGNDLQGLADRLRQEAGVALIGPFEMQRVRPDGREMSWTLLTLDPGGADRQRSWPGFIDWHQSDQERLGWEGPGVHANGACAVAGVAVAVSDVSVEAERLERHLGLVREGNARFRLGPCAIDLVDSEADPAARRELEERGGGAFEVTLRVADLTQARSYLESVGAAPVPEKGGYLIPPESALGVRLILV
jgi:hypothetical protein